MRFTRIILCALLFAMLMGGCKDGSQRRAIPDRGHTETWELLPYYGELRFQVISEDTGAPIPDANLQVSNLHIEELRDQDVVGSDLDGRIEVHQMLRGITYLGDGPPSPTFIFRAPYHLTKTLTVDDLSAGTSYDPYKNRGLPRTQFKTEAGEAIELPVYEWTIRLAPAD